MEVVDHPVGQVVQAVLAPHELCLKLLKKKPWTAKFERIGKLQPQTYHLQLFPSDLLELEAPGAVLKRLLLNPHAPVELDDLLEAELDGLHPQVAQAEVVVAHYPYLRRADSTHVLRDPTALFGSCWGFKVTPTPGPWG